MEVNMDYARYFIFLSLLFFAQPTFAMQLSEKEREQQLLDKEDVSEENEKKISEKSSQEEPSTIIENASGKEPFILKDEKALFWSEKIDVANKKNNTHQIHELENEITPDDTINPNITENNSNSQDKAQFWLENFFTLAHKLDKDNPEKMLEIILKKVLKKLDPAFYEECVVEYSKRFKEEKETLFDRQFKKCDNFIKNVRSQSLLSNALTFAGFVLYRFDGALLPLAYRTSWLLFLPLLAWKLGIKDHFPIMRAVAKEIIEESKAKETKK